MERSEGDLQPDAVEFFFLRIPSSSYLLKKVCDCTPFHDEDDEKNSVDFEKKKDYTHTN